MSDTIAGLMSDTIATLSQWADGLAQASQKGD